MLNLAGKWRPRYSNLVYIVEHDPQVPSNITWWDTNNKEQQYGHGVIDGDKVTISWRGNLGNGAAESQRSNLIR